MGESANLALPSLSTPINPSRAITDTTPTFSQTPVTGANLYFGLVMNAGLTTLWLGAPNTPKVTMPDLPPPAKLSSSNYDWFALNALSFRGAPRWTTS